jgi:hypothetical protein
MAPRGSQCSISARTSAIVAEGGGISGIWGSDAVRLGLTEGNPLLEHSVRLANGSGQSGAPRGVNIHGNIVDRCVRRCRGVWVEGTVLCFGAEIGICFKQGWNLLDLQRKLWIDFGNVVLDSRQQRFERGTCGCNAMAGRRTQQLEDSRKRIPGRNRKWLLMHTSATCADSLVGRRTIKSAVMSPATMAWYNTVSECAMIATTSPSRP